MTEAEADGAAMTVEAPVAHTPQRAKAKQKTPQQKAALEEVFASVPLPLRIATSFYLRFVFCLKPGPNS